MTEIVSPLIVGGQVTAGSIAASTGLGPAGTHAIGDLSSAGGFSGYVPVEASATVKLEAFEQVVAQRAPTLPWLAAKPLVRQACIEWFQRTQCWRATVGLESVGVYDTYTLHLPGHTALSRVLEVRRDGVRVELSSLQGFLDQPGSGLEQSASTNRLTIRMGPVPNGATHFDVAITLKPSQDADEIPAEFFEQYAEDIAQGTLSRVLRIPGRDWTDLVGAQYCLSQFERRIAVVGTLASRGYSRSKIRTRPVMF